MMKNIKTFDQLFESESGSKDRMPLYHYLQKCLTSRFDGNNRVQYQYVGIQIFPNSDAGDVFDYRVNGIKTLDVSMNPYFNRGSISYAFIQALNPDPDKGIMYCYPGLNLGNLISKIRFVIGDFDENVTEYIKTSEDGIREINVSGDNQYVFKSIISQLLIAFSEFGDRFFIAYAGTGSQKLSLPEYSNFIKNYLKYLSKLNIGDPINYDLLKDIDNFFKKNPLDLYKIDDLEEFKAGVLERTGLKDFGKIGRNLKSGII